MEHDLNLWGIFCVPVGVLVCFGPALLVWIVREMRAPSQDLRQRR